ncbi:MAG: aminotransferase class V-fold PLP-dependent enzyme [Phycisphaeraceae bacterium]
MTAKPKHDPHRNPAPLTADSSEVPREQAETRFPILTEMDFFNHAGVAPLSGPAGEAMAEWARDAARRAYTGGGWYKRCEHLKTLCARMIHARGPHEIALVPNTSTGLALVARGLPWKRGDHIVTTGVEYPANRYPWQDLERLGVTRTEIAQRPDGRIDANEVCDAVTDDTKLVAISHVQYASGHRIALRDIADTVHRVRGYLCVDAIQSVGVMPVDVQRDGVDFLSADGHKWMLGPEGCGLFYCHEDLCELLHPAVVGWLNMVDAHNYAEYRFEFHKDARRFEPGSWNVPGAFGLAASLDLLLGVGMEHVWQRLDALTTHLCEGLQSKGCRVFTPRDHPEERSGIVVFDPPDAERGGKPPAWIAGQLKKRNIEIAVRGGRLRASPHFYNTFEQIDRLIDALPGS